MTIHRLKYGDKEGGRMTLPGHVVPLDRVAPLIQDDPDGRSLAEILCDDALLAYRIAACPVSDWDSAVGNLEEKIHDLKCLLGASNRRRASEAAGELLARVRLCRTRGDLPAAHADETLRTVRDLVGKPPER